MSTDELSQVEHPRRRYGLRLRILVGLNLLLLVLFVISRLSPSQATILGPWGQSVYNMLTLSEAPSLSPAAVLVQEEVRAFGGNMNPMGFTPRYLGLFGETELFRIQQLRAEFTDDDLARLARKLGSHIGGLDLRGTSVTDDGLRYLKMMPYLSQLVLGSYFWRPTGDSKSPITEAGMAHLRDLPQLVDLQLDGLPVTEEGLGAIGSLPNLETLHLTRAHISGGGLSRLQALPKLASLDLDSSDLANNPLGSLAGAANLHYLSLRGISLSGDDLKALEALPRLQRLNIEACGLLDEEVEQFRMSRPEVKIDR